MNNSKHNRPEDQLPIRFLHLVNTLFARVYHRLTVISPTQLPKKGPAILVCNHTCSIDPCFLQSSSRYRLIRWMMAKEYLDLPGTGWFFKTMDIIPVERSGRDTGPLRAAIRSLEDGRVLGIFPEGKIETSHEMLPFQTGVALMAIKAGVPVYPAYLGGTQRNTSMIRGALGRNDTFVAYGPPVEFDRSSTSRENLVVATAAIKSAMEKLRDETEARAKSFYL